MALSWTHWLRFLDEPPVAPHSPWARSWHALKGSRVHTPHVAHNGDDLTLDALAQAQAMVAPHLLHFAGQWGQ